MHTKVLVIADDLTGANDTGALLAKEGFCAVASPSAKVQPDLACNKDVLAINADTRSMDREDAYACVKELAKRHAKAGMLVSKRIDSTLRGNVGAEIDAVLEGLQSPHKAAVVVSFPRARRTCVGGYVLVNGVALEHTSAAADPRCPVNTSRILQVIAQQSRRSARLFPLETIYAGAQALAKEISQCKDSIMVFDALTEDDIQTIAKACVLSKVPFVCVDPGSFTLHCAKEMYADFLQTSVNQTLLIVGSHMQKAREQLDYMAQTADMLMYKIDVQRLMDDFDAECQSAIEYLLSCTRSHRLMCLTTAYGAKINNPKVQEELPQRLVALVERVMSAGKWPIKLCYLCGGDVAKAFIDGSGADGIDLIDEVIPLAVYGTLMGGRHSGMRILTKGGMIGESDAIANMLYLVEGRCK